MWFVNFILCLDVNYFYIFFRQLQQERRKGATEAAEARRDREATRGQEQLLQTQAQVAALKSQLEETEWGLCQKSGQ